MYWAWGCWPRARLRLRPLVCACWDWPALLWDEALWALDRAAPQVRHWALLSQFRAWQREQPQRLVMGAGGWDRGGGLG